MTRQRALFAALAPPMDDEVFLREAPELSLARGLEGSPYHHLDTLDHVLEVIRRVEEELAAGRLGADVPEDRVDGLRLAALLHDVAKPITRGELERFSSWPTTPWARPWCTASAAGFASRRPVRTSPPP